MLPLEVFLYNWTCVELSLVSEKEAIEEAQKSTKTSGGKQANFEDWMSEVSRENASNIKKQKYGIERRKK